MSLYQAPPVDVWSKIADGELPIRALLGVSDAGIAQASELARRAFESGRFEQALRIFTGLEALESDRPEHSLHRSYTEARIGRTADALASVTRFLEATALRPVDRVRGLLHRASLLAAQDRETAKRDLFAAYALGTEDAEARALVERCRS